MQTDLRNDLAERVRDLMVDAGLSDGACENVLKVLTDEVTRSWADDAEAAQLRAAERR